MKVFQGERDDIQSRTCARFCFGLCYDALLLTSCLAIVPLPAYPCPQVGIKVFQGEREMAADIQSRTCFWFCFGPLL